MNVIVKPHVIALACRPGRKEAPGVITGQTLSRLKQSDRLKQSHHNPIPSSITKPL